MDVLFYTVRRGVSELGTYSELEATHAYVWALFEAIGLEETVELLNYAELKKIRDLFRKLGYFAKYHNEVQTVGLVTLLTDLSLYKSKALVRRAREVEFSWHHPE